MLSVHKLHNKFAVSAAIVGALVTFVAACSSSTQPAESGTENTAGGSTSSAQSNLPTASGGSTTPAAENSSPIKVAVIDAQSGQFSSLGEWDLRGIKLAIDPVNAAGGINGRHIDLTVYDDKGDPTTATNLARKAISYGVIAAFATTTSGTTLATASIFEQAKIPQITSGQSDAIPATGSPYLFMNSPTATAFDETLAEYLVKSKHYSKIAMISNNGAYGKGEQAAFKAALQKLGITPLTDLVVTPDQQDFSSVLTKVRAQNPEVIFLGSEEVESGLIMKQARSLGITAPFAGSGPVGNDVAIKTAGGASAAAGTIVSTPYLVDANEASKEFAQKYEALYHETPEFHAAKAYDGAMILIKALQETNVATGEELANAIRNINYDGLCGNFKFDATGVGVHENRIGTVNDQGALVSATSQS